MVEAFHDMWITTQPDGSAVIWNQTNDNDDDGYPDGDVEMWETHAPTVEAALKHCGRTRTGISGIRVRVFLDGSEVTS